MIIFLFRRWFWSWYSPKMMWPYLKIQTILLICGYYYPSKLSIPEPFVCLFRVFCLQLYNFHSIPSNSTFHMISSSPAVFLNPFASYSGFSFCEPAQWPYSLAFLLFFTVLLFSFDTFWQHSSCHLIETWLYFGWPTANISPLNASAVNFIVDLSGTCFHSQHLI